MLTPKFNNQIILVNTPSSLTIDESQRRSTDRVSYKNSQAKKNQRSNSKYQLFKINLDKISSKPKITSTTKKTKILKIIVKP